MTHNEITEGTRVAYARSFLQSTAQVTGWAAFAAGVVVDVSKVLPEIVTIKWDEKNRSGERGPAFSRVNVKNLVREDRIHLEPV
jgi:hypothetical protein